jgi:ABC-type nickel/cobalt efflux system permease component RcnA
LPSQTEVLLLGLLLGVRHALDPDHLVAVTTIVSDCKNPLKSVWVGISWGLGHTLTLFLAGIALLMLKIQIPAKLGQGFEFMVGIMLLLLGVQTLLSFRKRKVHVHAHRHADGAGEHRHFHLHETTSGHVHTHSPQQDLGKLIAADIVPGEHYSGTNQRELTPVFRLKSFLVGTVHGLAGSAALMLLVLAGIKSTWTGVTYILVFGLGPAVSMGLISIFISLPFSVSGRLPALNRAIQAAAGTVSILFGLFMMYQIASG